MRIKIPSYLLNNIFANICTFEISLRVTFFWGLQRHLVFTLFSDLKMSDRNRVMSDFDFIELPGEVLGLENVPVVVKCPSCGFSGNSEIRKEPVTMRQYFRGCVMCCAMLCKRDPSWEFTDTNHFCKECGCYFGRYKERK